MGLTELAMIFSVSLANVSLRAFQQLNVFYEKRAFVIPTSLLMTTCEVILVVQMVRFPSLAFILSCGLGAGIGCLLAMAIHKRVRGRS